jgi:hypothetical protein
MVNQISETLSTMQQNRLKIGPQSVEQVPCISKAQNIDDVNPTGGNPFPNCLPLAT